MADKKDVFGIAKGSPAVGIPLAVAKLGGKVQEAHNKFARKHPKVHATHTKLTRQAKRAGRKVVRQVKGAYRSATR